MTEIIYFFPMFFLIGFDRTNKNIKQLLVQDFRDPDRVSYQYFTFKLSLESPMGICSTYDTTKYCSLHEYIFYVLSFCVHRSQVSRNIPEICDAKSPPGTLPGKLYQ